MTTTVAFIGLGVMGYPMAGHLANAGLSVRVWNRSGEKATQWASEHSGAACDSIALAVRDADFVITCVGADKDLIEVFEGDEGIIANAPEGAILIDHTTASAGIAERLAESAGARKQAFIDAPVSGGQQGAQQAEITIQRKIETKKASQKGFVCRYSKERLRAATQSARKAEYKVMAAP